jgi:hypothetical protein
MTLREDGWTLATIKHKVLKCLIAQSLEGDRPLHSRRALDFAAARKGAFLRTNHLFRLCPLDGQRPALRLDCLELLHIELT